MKRTVFISMAIICAINLSACGKADVTTPDVVYYYSETEGIKMECLSDYYNMTLYEGGIIEYISGGVTYIMTYLQFQEETENWELAVRVVIDWDSQTDSAKGYYWGIIWGT